MDLLTTYTTDLELQSITTPPLIPTVQKLPQNPLSFFPARYAFTGRFLAAISNS
jgi:hypothetical protein